jgi:Na+/melibiose symporter-like transporter
MHAPRSPRLKPLTLAAYGQIALPLAIADLPIDLYLQNYYGALGVALESMAVVILLARLSDVITDPLIGVLSDRTANSFWGQRKNWVLAGIPVKMIGIYYLFFVTPGAASANYLLLWLVVLYLGWTMVTIPYGAWGAELSDDYHERSQITGWRTAFGLFGVFLASIAPLFTGGGPGTPQGLTPVMHGLGTWALVLFPFSMALLYFGVPNPKPRSITGGLTWWQGLKVAAANGPFMRILIASTLGRVGGAINQAVIIWFFTFAMGIEGPSAFLPVICYLLTAVLGVPIWVEVAKRWTKHQTLVVAVVFSIACFALLLFVPKGALGLSCLVLALAGIGGSAAAILGPSIAADVIELDELKAGKSRAGLLIAIWGMGQKAAAAVGYFVALMILAQFGFDAKAGAVNEGSAITGLTLTYIVVPWFFYAASIVLLWNFPLGPEEQRRIRAELTARSAAE